MLLKEIIKDRSFQLSFFLTLLFLGIGVAFLFLGWVGYSWALFIVLPIVLGVALGALPGKKTILWGVGIGVVSLLGGLYLPGLSGLLCIAMAIPCIFPFIFLGYVITYLLNRARKIEAEYKTHILLLPLIPFLFIGPTEHFINKDKEAVIAVTNERIYNYSPEQVYDCIKSVDTVYAEKPFLMYFDLPIPVKCVLDKEEVGGIRTCYFKEGSYSNEEFGSGSITERITQLERGKILKMDVVDYNVVGRKWLGFKEAIYLFEKVGEGKCKMTRVTTYTSVLTPRWYWEPLERWGIQDEHEYVFNSLERDLNQL